MRISDWSSDVCSSDLSKRMLWVPPGFAHGFLTLTDTADFQYKCTDYYAPEWEQALLWNDPAIGVEWPLEAGQQPSLSAKAAAGLMLDRAETFECRCWSPARTGSLAERWRQPFRPRSRLSRSDRKSTRLHSS